MKKLFIFVTSLIFMSVILIGCVQDNITQTDLENDIIQYYESMDEVWELEQEVKSSFGYVATFKAATLEDAITKIDFEIKPLIGEWEEKANSVHPNTNELIEVHDKYLVMSQRYTYMVDYFRTMLKYEDKESGAAFSKELEEVLGLSEEYTDGLEYLVENVFPSED